MGFWDSATQGFNSGFAYAEDKQRADREFALKQQLHDKQMEEAALRLGALRRVDAADNALTNAFTLGMQVPGAQQNNEMLQREAFRKFEISQQNQQEGEAAPTYTAPTVGLQQTYRPATEREILGLRKTAAVARGQDIGGLVKEGKDLDWVDAYKGHMKAWDDMPAEQRAAEIERLSKGDFVRGYGSLETKILPGGKSTNYLHYVAPGKSPLTFNDSEMRQLWALGNMMYVDPIRAQAEADKLTGKLQAVVKDMFHAQTEGAKVSNTAQHYLETGIETNRHNVAEEGLKAQHNDIIKAHYGRRDQPSVPFKLAQITVPDAASGKTSKVPVSYRVVEANGVPTVQAYTLDGKQISDNRLLSQLAGGQGAEENPITAQFNVMRQTVLGNKDLDPKDMVARLGQIDKMQNIAVLRPQIAALPAQERVPELRKLMQTGMFAPEELNATFGFSFTEIKEAQKPAAGLNPRAAAPTSAPAPGNAATSNLNDDQLRAAFKKHGALGYKEALLGPQPGMRNAAGLREWNARSQALDARLQDLFAKPSN